MASNSIHDHANAFLGLIDSNEQFFSVAISDKQAQIAIYEKAMLEEIEHVKGTYGQLIANCHRELANLQKHCQFLGLRQVMIDTGQDEGKRGHANG